MTNSVRETALKALHAALSRIPGPIVARNEPEPSRIPTGGLVVLRDGEPGDPDVLLSPTSYIYTHRVEVEVLVQNGNSLTRDTAMDTLLQAIGAAISADETLGGAVDKAWPGSPELISEPVEGAAAIKAALAPVFLEYITSTPLG